MPAACRSTTIARRGSNIVQRVFFTLAVRPFLALFVGLRVRGREHLPAADPFILIANHSSHIDAVALLSLFPGTRLKHIRPVAAADYFERNRFVGWLTRALFHTLPIERDATSPETDPRPRMLAALAAGESLILFPEGTRGSGTDLGRFRRGIAWLAEHRPDIPIVPAYLENMGRALPKGEFLPVPILLRNSSRTCALSNGIDGGDPAGPGGRGAPTPRWGACGPAVG